MTINARPRPAPARDGARLAVLSNRLGGDRAPHGQHPRALGPLGCAQHRARDFSCCILTADDEVLTTGNSLPIHVMGGPELQAQWLREFYPVLRAGDAYLHNSPYHGNTHAADHSIMVPVVDADGIHRFTVVAKEHQADCGNSVPTTYHGERATMCEEGALIFPVTRVQENYEDLDDILRMCRMRIRVPDQWYGDYLAIMGAARIGERGLLAWARRSAGMRSPRSRPTGSTTARSGWRRRSARSVRHRDHHDHARPVPRGAGRDRHPGEGRRAAE